MSIGRIYHKVTLIDQKVKVTRYRPRSVHDEHCDIGASLSEQMCLNEVRCMGYCRTGTFIRLLISSIAVHFNLQSFQPSSQGSCRL